MALDEYTLQLAVGVKDLYTKKIEDIEAKTDEFRQKTEQLQKTVSNIEAYKRAEATIQSLSNTQKKLAQELDAVSRTKKDVAQEAEKLKKSLQGQASASEKDKKRLKQLQKEFRLLEEREKHLRKEIDETSAKQDKEIATLKRLSSALSRAGVETKDLGSELNRLQKELAQVEKKAKEAEKVSSLKEKLASGAVVAGAGTFVGMLAKDVYSYDKAIHRLAATTKLSISQAEELKTKMVDIYVATGKPVEEIEQALKLVVQQLGLSGKAAGDAAKSILKLSQVHPELDTQEMVKAASQMSKAWGISVAESTDLMATILEKAGDKAGDLMDTLWEYSPLMKEAGLSAKQFTAMLIKGAQAGAYNFDKLADSIKESFKARISDIDMWDALMGKGDKQGTLDEVLNRFGLQKAGDEIKTYLGQLRQGLLTGDDKLKSEAYSKLLTRLSVLYKKDAQATRNIIEQIFGTQGAEDLTGNVLKAMGDAIAAPDKVLGGFKGALNRQFKESLTLFDELKIAWRSVTSVFTIGASEIAKDLAPVGKVIAGLAKGVAGFVKEHPAVAKFLTLLAGGIAIAGSLAVALGAVGFVVSGIGTGLATLGPLLSSLATGFSIAGKAAMFLGRGFMVLVTNPVGLTLMAIAGAGYLIYKNWDNIKNIFGIVWEKIKGIGALLAKGFKLVWDFSPLGMLFKLGKKVYNFFSNIDLSEAGAKLLKTLASGIKSAIAYPFKALKKGLGFLRKLLPFSDAKEGPLSDLTESGRKVLLTMATGVKEAGPKLAEHTKKALAGTAAALSVASPVLAGSPQTPTSSLPDLRVKARYETQAPSVPRLPELLGKGAYSLEMPKAPTLPELLGRGAYVVEKPKVPGLPEIRGKAKYDVQTPTSSLPDLRAKIPARGRGVTINLTFNPKIEVSGENKEEVKSEVLQVLKDQSSELLVVLERAMNEILSRHDYRRV